MIKLYEIYNFIYTDDLGQEINKDATIGGLFDCLLLRRSVYNYIGVHDSVVRERLFQYIANCTGSHYNDIYSLWSTNH